MQDAPMQPIPIATASFITSVCPVIESISCVEFDLLDARDIFRLTGEDLPDFTFLDAKKSDSQCI